MTRGAITFVLHSHIPYVRRAGGWPHGEETLHEAMAETYIPLLNALFELKDEGVEPRLTLGLTPILLEQLADKDVCEHFERYVEERLALAQSDLCLYTGQVDAQRQKLARWYHNWYTMILTSFREHYHRDLVGAFRALWSDGNVDILTGAATHGYLPLLGRDSSIYGQLKVGFDTSRAHLGRAPTGIWLPECGYRPADQQESHYKPGLESFLSGLNLHYFFAESYAITKGKLAGKIASHDFGPQPGVPGHQPVIPTAERRQARRRTTMRPYYVNATSVAVFGRDARTSTQVWSTSSGYPGHVVYREFHRQEAHSGLRYWRITDAGAELRGRDWYDPTRARQQVLVHAQHFVGLVEKLVTSFAARHGQAGIVVSAYDTELFGHWWLEGVAWFKEVQRLLARSRIIEPTTAGTYLHTHPPDEALALPESSWGSGHWAWLNPDTEWMWPLIHAAERTMEGLVEQFPAAEGDLLRLLNQATRELLLLESSDWPFLMSTGQAKEYASGRFQQHLARFNHLHAIAQRGRIEEVDRRFLEMVMELDNPFTNLDYRVLAARERVRGEVAGRLG